MKGTASQPQPTPHHARIGKCSAQRHRREDISDGSRRGETPSATRCAARTARPGVAGRGTSTYSVNVDGRRPMGSADQPNAALTGTHGKRGMQDGPIHSTTHPNRRPDFERSAAESAMSPCALEAKRRPPHIHADVPAHRHACTPRIAAAGWPCQTLPATYGRTATALEALRKT